MAAKRSRPERYRRDASGIPRVITSSTSDGMKVIASSAAMPTASGRGDGADVTAQPSHNPARMVASLARNATQSVAKSNSHQPRFRPSPKAEKRLPRTIHAAGRHASKATSISAGPAGLSGANRSCKATDAW